MKIRTLKRHLREGFKNIFRNGWMSVASIGSVTVTLILVAAFLVLILNINNMAQKVEDDVVVKVLIDVAADDQEVKSLREEIEQLPKVDSVLFSSKDEELKDLIESMGEEGKSWELFEQDNPLNHAFIVKAKEPQDTVDIAGKISNYQHVYKVTYGKEVVSRLFTFNKYARVTGLILIVGLVFTAIFLISNTIKLTIMARSKEIGIMKLVGATNGFIRWPFFIEGMMLGIVGSIIPIVLLLVGYRFVLENLVSKVQLPFFELLPVNPFVWQLSLLILAIGGLIGIWGSVMSVRKFLKV